MKTKVGTIWKAILTKDAKLMDFLSFGNKNQLFFRMEAGGLATNQQLNFFAVNDPIKRWPSFTKQLSRARSSVASSTNESDDVSKQELHAVYVGKTRRRYLVSSEIIDHPLFQELVEKSSGEYDDGVAVSCEVVLFEHLLWMLDNAENQLGSMDELVEFYTTC
ncbi:auxin-responsive protein saur78 [Quercus suber]|uniref:Auxin-responsive protein saur78 n=1 Tax=Quercus suber TaxID=58331 RepID=A0AAW0KQH6_QUESU